VVTSFSILATERSNRVAGACADTNRAASSAKESGALGVSALAEHERPDILFAQSPSAHIARQGNTPMRNGTAPAATSQLQLNASPATSAMADHTASPRRPLR